jgi:galactoside O-acetyltransferase
MFIRLLRKIFLSVRTGKSIILHNWYRFYFFVITKDSSMKIDVHSSVEIRNSEKVTINKNSIIKKGTIINGRSSKEIGINFGEETYIKEYCYIDAYDGEINFEGYTAIGQFCIIAGEGNINIGKYVMIGAHSYIITCNHIFKGLHIPYILQGNNAKPIVIKDNVWIGGNVIILPGVTIGENSVIGAGSIVDKDVPPNTIYYTTRTEGKNEKINYKE